MAMTDAQLRQDVIHALEFEPSVDAAHIGVTAEKGVVTLTGHVASYAEKLAAEDVARGVKGVRAIAQEIEVRYPDHKHTADDEIAERAVKILAWTSAVPAGAVTVTVAKGWVTLTGEVSWQYQKRVAENAVHKLSGVIGIVNRITLKPAVTVSDVKEKIEAALTRHAQVEAEAIRVSVFDGNKVLLDGIVDSLDAREAAEKAAWSVAGVRSVDDRLTVVPY
jgi:osmotically-inducible protein OsmY